MSNAVCDIDVEFGEPSTSGAGGELRLPAEFLSHHAFDHNVNRFLKVAHPGAFVVAVSLAESRDGFCDESFAAWRSALAGLAADVLLIAQALSTLDRPRAARRSPSPGAGGVQRTACRPVAGRGDAAPAQTADAFPARDASGRAADRPGAS
jgi:hypothetical protein